MFQSITSRKKWSAQESNTKLLSFVVHPRKPSENNTNPNGKIKAILFLKKCT